MPRAKFLLAVASLFSVLLVLIPQCHVLLLCELRFPLYDVGAAKTRASLLAVHLTEYPIMYSLVFGYINNTLVNIHV